MAAPRATTSSGLTLRAGRRPKICSSLRWTIMLLTEGAAASVDPQVRTWSEYRAALATLNRAAANWQMVPLHELAA